MLHPWGQDLGDQGQRVRDSWRAGSMALGGGGTDMGSLAATGSARGVLPSASAPWTSSSSKDFMSFYYQHYASGLPPPSFDEKPGWRLRASPQLDQELDPGFLLWPPCTGGFYVTNTCWESGPDPSVGPAHKPMICPRGHRCTGTRREHTSPAPPHLYDLSTAGLELRVRLQLPRTHPRAVDHNIHTLGKQLRRDRDNALSSTGSDAAPGGTRFLHQS